MQALKNGRGLAALLLAGGLVLLAAGAGYAQDASDATTSDTDAQVDAEAAAATGDDTARRNNQSCLNRFGPDLVQAFNRDPNDEPVNADNVALTLTPRAEPVDVPC